MKWQSLKDLFQGRFKIRFADVVHIRQDNEAYGIVEFHTELDALKACRQFNGVLLNDRPIRLREDRGEFDELQEMSQRPAAPPLLNRASNVKARTAASSDGSALPEEKKPEDMIEEDEGDGDASDEYEDRRHMPKHKVFVGNLDFQISWQTLKDHMRQAGDVGFCDVLKNEYGAPKGCAFVGYTSKGDCLKAIQTLHETTVGNRQIYVIPVTKRRKNRC